MKAYHKLKGTNGQRTTTNGGAVSVFIVYPFISVYFIYLTDVFRMTRVVSTHT